jgi:hypothetical protein
MTELRQLSMMAARFVDFDIAGKEMYLDKVGECLLACLPEQALLA